MPIIALTPFMEAARRMVLSWGTHCVVTQPVERFKFAVVSAVRAAKASGFAHPSDQVVVTAGIPFNVAGSTNILRVAPCDERLIFGAEAD